MPVPDSYVFGAKFWSTPRYHQDSGRFSGFVGFFKPVSIHKGHKITFFCVHPSAQSSSSGGSPSGRGPGVSCRSIIPFSILRSCPPFADSFCVHCLGEFPALRVSGCKKDISRMLDILGPFSLEPFHFGYFWGHFHISESSLVKLRISSLSIFNHPQQKHDQQGPVLWPPSTVFDFFRPVLNQLADFAQHTALPQFCLHHVAHLTAMGRAQMYFVSIHLYDYVCIYINMYISLYIYHYIYIYIIIYISLYIYHYIYINHYIYIIIYHYISYISLYIIIYHYISLYIYKSFYIYTS